MPRDETLHEEHGRNLDGPLLDDQTSSDADQTSSDADQTASDADQTWSDVDQSSSEADQASSDADQRASDGDVRAGGDPAVHAETTAARRRASADREQIVRLRDDTARARLLDGDERDRQAAERDRQADQRDRSAALVDSREAGERGSISPEFTGELVAVRQRAALARARAASDRERAAADRHQAAADRHQAAAQHAASEAALRLAATDELTGALGRRAGLAAIERELERARRTGTGPSLAFIDVVDLKAVNDSGGHQAGDELLRLVASTVRSRVRPYDLLIRYGGDEFLFLMPQADQAAAEQRLEEIRGALPGERSIDYGITEWLHDDSAESLIGRADSALLVSQSASKGAVPPTPVPAA